MIYNPKRLEWHLGDGKADRPPQVAVWSCKVASEAFACISNRLAAALPRAKTTEQLAGVFAFGLRNAVRRWLRLGYPVTRASQSRGGGRIPRAGWLKESGIVRCDGMAPESRCTERTLVMTTVRLCFAQTFTRKQMMISIRVGDIDYQGKNGGTMYIVELAPSIKFEMRLTDILTSEGKEKFELLVDENLKMLTSEKLKEMFLDEYDKYVQNRIKSLKN